jgi:LuxR family maltose regulon positive regulatory protein
MGQELLMESVILIRTKLHRPRGVSDLVERPRLLEQLNWNLDRTLTLIAAPAGYGKSTLAAQWLESCECPGAWLSLDERDSDLGVFLNYFIAAIQSIFPDAGNEILTLLQAPERPPLSVLTRALINDLDRIDQPFILALDDYHLIHDIAVHELLNELLRHAPRALHLMIISRLDPPINFRKLRARGQMTEIRTEDLRFTPAEIRQFFQKTWGQPFDDALVARFQETTEGWATGLRLYSLASSNPEDFDAIADQFASKRLVADYLFHEVFVSLPEDVRTYLLKTSIFDRFSVSLCDCMKEIPPASASMNGRDFIARLEQADAFMIPLDDQREWFRYHHLFRDVLKRQLTREVDAETIARLHRCASDWFAKNDLIGEAIQHALAADAPNLAAELIEQHKDEALNKAQWPVLARWLSSLPEEIIQQRVGLLMARLWISHIHYDIRAVELSLGQLDALLGDAEPDSATAGERAFFQGAQTFWRGEIEQSVERFEAAMTLIPSENKFALGAVDVYLATAYQMTGQIKKSVTIYRALLEAEKKDNSRRGKLLGALIFVFLLSGDTANAYKVIRRMKSMAEGMDDPFFIGWAHYLLGNIHFGWNELEVALPHFVQVIENRFFLNPNIVIDSYIGLAISYQALGQGKQTDAVMEQLFEYVAPLPPIAALTARSARTRLALQRGEQQGIQLLRTIDFASDRGTMSLHLEYPRITHARLLMASGTETSLAESILLLQEHLQSVRSTHNIRQLVIILPLLAVAYHQSGHQQKAIKTLKESVRLAEPGGWIRPFLEFGPEMAALLNAVRWKSNRRDFIDQIRRALPPARDGRTFQRERLPEPLTDREREVLALLARRYQIKEIAAELVIAPATVSRHTSNIYQKLGVNKRRDAVEKALMLGIIQPPR